MSDCKLNNLLSFCELGFVFAVVPIMLLAKKFRVDLAGNIKTRCENIVVTFCDFIVFAFFFFFFFMIRGNFR